MLDLVDNVGHHRAGGGQLAGATTVKYHVADGVAADHNAVENIVDIRQQAGFRQDHRRHDSVETAVRLFLSPADEFDHPVQSRRIVYILQGDRTDAFGMDLGLSLIHI